MTHRAFSERECHNLNLFVLAKSLGCLQFYAAKPESQILKKGWAEVTEVRDGARCTMAGSWRLTVKE